MKAMSSNRMIEYLGTCGAAIEHQTVLGRILRISIDPRDPVIFDGFRDLFRQTKSYAENKINTLRSINKNIVNKASEIVLSILKAGSPAKDITIAWIIDTLSLNKEASKDNPNASVVSSPGMLVNFSSVTLKLCLPFLSDPAKLKKVDWNFIFHKDSYEIIPKDETKLTTLSASDQDSATSLMPSTEFNFITQSFFICWRAIHLGLVSQFSKYINHLRRLNHFHSELANEAPHAISALVHKVTVDTLLLEPVLLEELILFFSSSSSSLFNVLSEGTISDSSNSDWVVPESGNIILKYTALYQLCIINLLHFLFKN